MLNPTQLPAPAVPREELHFRRIDMRAFRRADGLFEVEGSVVDRKPFDFQAGPEANFIPAAQPAHDLGVRLVFDETLLVHEVYTFSAAYPYRECPGGGAALQSLRGLRMSGGWTREVRSRVGGAYGCTHLMELLTPMATAAYQAVAPLRQHLPERLDADGRPVKIDSCYAYGASLELVRGRWPAFAIVQEK